MASIAQTLKSKVPDIRYVAVNSGGKITEMEQFTPSHNPQATDLMEELLVNPTVLEITTRRGNLDLDGVHFVVIRYGAQYQAIFRYGNGHVSVGIDLDKDPISTVEAIQKALGEKNISDNPNSSGSTPGEPEPLHPGNTLHGSRTKIHNLIGRLSTVLCRSLSGEFKLYWR